MYAIRDLNPEALDVPLAMLHAEQARQDGLPLDDYFRDHSDFQKLKIISPQCMDYFGWFWLRFAAYQMPPAAWLIYGFQKLFGPGQETVTLYSVFFAFVALYLTMGLGKRMGGGTQGVIAGLLMVCSMSFLVHTKTAYSHMTLSIALITGWMWALYDFGKTFRRRNLLIAGALLGIMYLLGWIVVVFAGMAAGPLIFMARKETSSKRSLVIRLTIKDGLWLGMTATGTAILLAWAYSLYFHASFAAIFEAIHAVMFGRFKQSGGTGSPWIEGSLSEHVYQVVRRTFFNMRDFKNPHHIDKQIDGVPAVAWLGGVAFVLGLYKAFRDRQFADKLLVVWVGVVFGFVAFAFQFEHRYILTCLPAISILGAKGILAAYRRAGAIHRKAAVGIALFFALGIGFSAVTTWNVYYGRWARSDFMNLRFHGQRQLTDYLKTLGEPREVKVILGDPVMFPHGCFLFNTFGWDYDFDYFTNAIKPDTPLEKIREWESRLFQKHRRVALVFSSEVFFHPYFGRYSNDWRPFLALHPGIQPMRVISYTDGHPSMYVFILDEKKDTSRSPASTKRVL